MRFLFYLAHPAHFHLFKNQIIELRRKNHEVIVLIQKKDILEQLLQEANMDYILIHSGSKKKSMFTLATSIIKKDYQIYKIALKFKPNLLISSGPEISHVGKLLKIPSLLVFEDDLDQVKLYSKIAPPFASKLIVPEYCRLGKWEKKGIKYKGYHELCYLGPGYFTANPNLLKGIVDYRQPYFIIRFSNLNAYHDKGKTGIDNEIAIKIISILKPKGKIIISSERELPQNLELYRVNINPLIMHHLMFYAKLYIGDSQTMAAEAAVLGTPSIRFNDFVGKLGYLDNLEEYGLTFGVKTSETDRLYNVISELSNEENNNSLWLERREKMLNENIDVNKFLLWIYENYSEDIQEFILKQNILGKFSFKKA